MQYVVKYQEFSMSYQTLQQDQKPQKQTVPGMNGEILITV